MGLWGRADLRSKLPTAAVHVCCPLTAYTCIISSASPGPIGGARVRTRPPPRAHVLVRLSGPLPRFRGNPRGDGVCGADVTITGFTRPYAPGVLLDNDTTINTRRVTIKDMRVTAGGTLDVGSALTVLNGAGAELVVPPRLLSVPCTVTRGLAAPCSACASSLGVSSCSAAAGGGRSDA